MTELTFCIFRKIFKSISLRMHITRRSAQVHIIFPDMILRNQHIKINDFQLLERHTVLPFYFHHHIGRLEITMDIIPVVVRFRIGPDGQKQLTDQVQAAPTGITSVGQIVDGGYILAQLLAFHQFQYNKKHRYFAAYSLFGSNGLHQKRRNNIDFCLLLQQCLLALQIPFCFLTFC